MCVDENAKFPRQYKLATAFCMIYAGCRLNPRVANEAGYENYIRSTVLPRANNFIANFKSNGEAAIGEVRSIVLGSTSVENMLRFKLAQDILSAMSAKKNIGAFKKHPIVTTPLPYFLSSISGYQWYGAVQEAVQFYQNLNVQDIPENQYMKWVDDFAVAAYNSLARSRAMTKYFDSMKNKAAASATSKIHTGRMVSRYSSYERCAMEANTRNAKIQFASLNDAAKSSDITYTNLVDAARKKLYKPRFYL